MICTTMKSVTGLAGLWHRLIADGRAAAAVEFAGLLPFMLLLYIGGVEVAQGVSADRKVTLTSRTVADLASRSTTISDTDMSDILNASSAVIAPFDPTKVTVTVSQVVVDSKGNATINWSDSLHGTARPQGQAVNLPSTLATACTRLLWGEAQYAYTPTLGYYMTGTLQLYDNIYMAPRMSDHVTRNTIAVPSCP
jgi:Flp pilus assembly protein TadG